MRNEKEHLLRKRPGLERVKDKAVMASPTGPTGEVGSLVCRSQTQAACLGRCL